MSLLSAPTFADDPPAIGFEKGKLQDVGERLSALLQLGVSGGKLELSRRHWNRDFEGKSEAEVLEAMIAQLMQNGLPREVAQQQAMNQIKRPRVELLFNQVQQAAQANSTSSRSSNNDRTISFSGRGLAGQLDIRGEFVSLKFEEEQPPHRKIEIQDDGNGAFMLTVSSRTGQLVLLVVQAAAGRFNIAEVRGEAIRAYTAATFLELYRRERTYIERTLYPLLQHLGVGTPTASDSPEVVSAVLARLRPLNDDDRRRAEELIFQLDADDFNEREAAEKMLHEEFSRLRSLIIEAAADESASKEASTRFKRLLARRVASEQLELQIEVLELATDASYLVGLYETAPRDERPFIRTALETATGQKFGDDLAQWKKWVAAQPPAAPMEKSPESK